MRGGHYVVSIGTDCQAPDLLVVSLEVREMK